MWNDDPKIEEERGNGGLNVEILSVGTELLLGGTANIDAMLLSRRLSELGLNVRYHTVVGDNPVRLRHAVELARLRCDILITTGGLGPTCDDLTKQTVAAAFNRKLVLQQSVVDSLRERFRQMGREMTENNLQQAMLPENCTILPNECGTAPGCAFESGGVHVIMLPGPPRECTAMFDGSAVKYLSLLQQGVILSSTVRIFGITESRLDEMLRDDMDSMENPTMAPYVKENDCELRVTAKAETRERAREMIGPVIEKLRMQLGDLIYGVDVSSLEQVALDGLRERGLTLGTAESCTGGLIAKRMTDLPGSSDVFRGGVVSYCNEVKESVLNVPEDVLAEYGAVSLQTAREMAEGARRVLHCDLAVSATGVAGPGPDREGNEAGLVYIGLAAEEGCFVRRVSLGDTGRERVRNLAAGHAFDMVRRWLNGLPLEDPSC